MAGKSKGYIVLAPRKRGVDRVVELADHLRSLSYTPSIDKETASVLTKQVCAKHGIDVRAPGDKPPPLLAVALGGDGSFIHAANLYAVHGIPLIGVNLGNVGFLADVPATVMIKEITAVLGGHYRDEQRIMLKVEHTRNKKVLFAGLVINDVVIDRGEMAALIRLDIAIDGRSSFELRADGLVFATPGGSTAYSISAGGPIITPDLGCIALTPLNPFSLTHRPLVFSTQRSFVVELLQNSARLILDGQVTNQLKPGDQVSVSTHQQHLTVRHPDSYNYFKTLREKLYWSRH